MRICSKGISTRTYKVHGDGKSIETTHKKAQQPTKHDDPQNSCSQTCVSPGETAKQKANHKNNTKRGQRPNKTATESICHRMQWVAHCITKKTCQWISDHGFSGNMKTLAFEFTLAWAKQYTKARPHIKPLSVFSHLRSARQCAFRDIVVVIIFVSRDPEAVMLKELGPPLPGGWIVMANRKQHRPGKSFEKYPRHYRHALVS